MKAVGFLNSLPIDDANSLFDVELPTPEFGPADLLVSVEAISVNPADAKRRIRTAVDQSHAKPFILGYDAVGKVEAMGADVSGFKVGDRVWYAGDVNRPGSYAEMQAVDHRLVSQAPKSVAPEAAASLPLVSLTSWEMLFDRLQVSTGAHAGTLLVIGGAGGVGSVTTQLARKLTGLRILATASRPESAEWCQQMGAHDVVAHRDLVAEVRKAGPEFVHYIAQYADTAQHWDAMCELIAPQGRIGTIVETDEKIDISALQGKSAALMWELMFTRSLFGTPDMAEQGRILSQMAHMVDDGVVSTTQTKAMRGLNAETLKDAHRLIETGSMIGKIVVTF
ncbi:MAG: zinc-binding alcohol dehydrogenase family protein [Cohaesibacter sp.]|nr:zinc-binding alcohol dehydrogenase family protein [Cohaesibacter sp.]